MTLNATGVLDAVQSHAMALGLFERVNLHEPKNAPGNGLTAAIWVDSVGAAAGHSSITSTTARLVVNLRVYSNMVAEPQDSIDPNILAAVDVLMNAYSGDLTLGNHVRAVDLLGMAGAPLSAQAGYLPQDGRMFRVMTIVIPLLINDAWDQVA